MHPSGVAGKSPGSDMAGPIRYQTNTQKDGVVYGMYTLSFGSAIVTAQSQEAGIMSHGGLAGAAKAVIVTPGSVVGIGVTASAATAASSSVEVKAKLGGTVKSGTLAVTMAAATDEVYGFTTNLRSFPVAAGDDVQIVYNSTTTDPAATLVATLYVL